MLFRFPAAQITAKVPQLQYSNDKSSMSGSTLSLKASTRILYSIVSLFILQGLNTCCCHALFVPSRSFSGHSNLVFARRRFRSTCSVSLSSSSSSNLSLSSNQPFNSSLSSSSSSSNKSPSSQRILGRTGWNHNLPGPSSSFWSSSDSTNNTNTNSNTNTNTTKNRPKTGWLHYNTPKSSRVEDSDSTASLSATTSSSTLAPLPLDIPSSTTQSHQQEMKHSSLFNHRFMAAPVLHPCGGGNKVAVITEHAISVPLRYYTNSEKENEGTILQRLEEEEEKEKQRKSLYTRIRQSQYSSNSSSSSSSSSSSGNWSPSTTSDEKDKETREDERIDLFFTVVETIQSPQDSQFLSQLIHQFHTYTPQEAAQLYVHHFSTTSSSTYNPSNCLLFLQGGPGFGAPIPISTIGLAEKSSWLGETLFGSGASHFHRVVLMDSRGTGRSTPITKQTLEKRFPNLFLLDSIVETTKKQHPPSSSSTTSEERIADELDHWEDLYPDITAKVGVAIGQAADYMSQFRADNIVRDAELLKEVLFLNPKDSDKDKTDIIGPYGGVLGQSYGGFCILTYLSLIEQPPKICLLTGGIPPIFTPIFELYSSLWMKIKERNRLFYQRYPGDVSQVKRIVKRLMDRPEVLPSGGLLTARRFLQLGLSLGGSPSAFASLHTLVSTAFVSSTDDIFSRSFLKSMDSTQPFDDHPIYFLLHESIYADGGRHSNPTSWAAHQVFHKMIEATPEFNYEVTSKQDREDVMTLFFGEVVFPWMCEGDYAELSEFGMRALANALADKNDWGNLYNTDRIKKSLSVESGTSKAAAAVYYGDMYVDFDASMRVVKELDEKINVWITNDYQHSGLRDDGAFIMAKLMGMMYGSVGTPS